MSSKKTVAVCDDNTPLVQMMRHFLDKKGYEVLTAGDGAEGLALVHANPVDVLLLDLEMPQMDGLTVLQKLKDAAGKRPYTIVISAQETASIRDRAASLGADEVWRKPFTVASLLSRLGDLIEQGTI